MMQYLYRPYQLLVSTRAVIAKILDAPAGAVPLNLVRRLLLTDQSIVKIENEADIKPALQALAQRLGTPLTITQPDKTESVVYKFDQPAARAEFIAGSEDLLNGQYNLLSRGFTVEELTAAGAAVGMTNAELSIIVTCLTGLPAWEED